MSKSFFKNLIWLQALNWLIKPVWIFAIERVVQMNLGDTMYGEYYVLFNLGLLFAVLLDLGLNSYVSREIAAAGRLIHKKRIVSVRLLMGFIYVLLVLILGKFQSLDLRFLALIILNQILASFTLLFRAILQGRQRFIADSILSVTDRFVAILVCAEFLYIPISEAEFVRNWFPIFNAKSGIFIFVFAQFSGYFIAFVTGLIWVQKTNHAISPSENEVLKESSSKNYLAEDTTLKDWLLHIGWFGVLALSMSFFTRIDTSMIHELAKSNNPSEGFFQAGLYAKSYRLLDAALIFSTLLSTQLLPLFTRNIALGESVKSLLKIGTGIVLGVSVVASLVSIFGGEFILQKLYYSKANSVMELATLSQSASIFAVLMTAFIPMALVHVFGTFITALGNIKWLAILALICVLINVTINWIVIPKYGAYGAAWGCFITQFSFAMACIIKTMQYLKLKEN